MNTQVNIGIVIPAAGSSSRMGKPKQLLPWMETTLLGNCIVIAQSICDKVTLVTGACKSEVEDEVEKFKVNTIYNPNWQEGLGKSIAIGVGHLVEKYQDIDGILILLPDQPFITQEYLEKMVEQFSNKENLILATQYDKKDYGVPVMFPEKYFEELKELTGDHGAKAILKKNADHVISILPEFKLSDIDTVEDYRDLLKN